MFIVFQYGKYSDKLIFRTPFEAIMNMFVISIGEFSNYYGELETSEHSIVGKVEKSNLQFSKYYYYYNFLN